MVAPVEVLAVAKVRRLAIRLEMEARGESLRVWLDGKVVFFDHGGKQVEQVPIPLAWNTAPIFGEDQGAAGVAFGTGEYRMVGGERARNLEVTAIGPTALPIGPPVSPR